MKFGLKHFGFDIVKGYKLEMSALFLGILLLVLPNIFGSSGSSGMSGNLSDSSATETVKSAGGDLAGDVSFADAEAKKLEGILKNVKGVGKADVIIHVGTSTKKVNAGETKSVNEETDEGDSNGGKRVNSKVEEDYTIKVIKDSDGNESPVHIYDEYPEIKGILISAEGADSNAVKETIINAVSALYGIPVHKVSVVKRS